MLKTGVAPVIVGDARPTEGQVHAWAIVGGDAATILEGREKGGLVDAVTPFVSG